MGVKQSKSEVSWKKQEDEIMTHFPMSNAQHQAKEEQSEQSSDSEQEQFEFKKKDLISSEDDSGSVSDAESDDEEEEGDEQDKQETRDDPSSLDLIQSELNNDFPTLSITSAKTKKHDGADTKQTMATDFPDSDSKAPAKSLNNRALAQIAKIKSAKTLVIQEDEQPMKKSIKRRKFKKKKA